MRCPNCTREFELRWDYAEHLRGCQPGQATAITTELLLARLNAAAALLEAEVAAYERGAGTAEPEPVLACA
jgi:hypothetical protein